MLRLQLGKTEGLTLIEIIQTAENLIEQSEVDVFPLEPMIVIQPLGVDQSGTAFTVLGDDLLRAFGVDLVDKLGQLRPGPSERHDVFRGKAHKTILNYVHNNGNYTFQNWPLGPYCLTSSTRRFFSLPAAVSFEATGAR